MATGQQHATATVIVGGFLTAGLYAIAQRPLPETTAFAIGCLTGLVINPDLDIRHITYSVQVVRVSGGQLGRWLARLWYGFWWPYSHVIPHHRHPLSHLPLLGTAGRLFYLWATFALLAYLANWLFKMPPFPEIPPAITGLFGWWLAGLSMVDALHTLMDMRSRNRWHMFLFTGPSPRPTRRRSQRPPQGPKPVR